MQFCPAPIKIPSDTNANFPGLLYKNSCRPPCNLAPPLQKFLRETSLILQPVIHSTVRRIRCLPARRVRPPWSRYRRSALSVLPLLVPGELAGPSEGGATGPATLDLQRQVCLLDVVAKSLNVAQPCLADVTEVATGGRLDRRFADDALAEARHHHLRRTQINDG